jgi:hypothetical protein
MPLPPADEPDTPIIGREPSSPSPTPLRERELKHRQLLQQSAKRLSDHS